MARTKFALDFDGFLDFARRVDELGEGYLKQATENALTKSKTYANEQILKAMESSPYAFIKGKRSSSNKPSTGRAYKSVKETSNLPVEWVGTTCYAYIGAELSESPEALILALGTPHVKADTNLKNASQVKGKYRRQVDQIQMEEFQKVISEAMNNG